MGTISMNLRLPVQSSNTMLVRQLGTASEILDANSTATTVVTSPQSQSVSAHRREWFPVVTKVRVLQIGESTLEVQSEVAPPVATTLGDVSLYETPEVAEAVSPGIFIAARPTRKKLFQLQFKVSPGGLPRRKPFVWI